MAPAMLLKANCTRLLIRSGKDSPMLRYGTWEAEMPVRIFRSSPARCGVVPTPADAKFSFPGFFFPYSINSATEFTLRAGAMTSTSGEELTMDTALSCLKRS